MTEPMYKRYADVKPVGIYSANAFFGILLFEPDEIDRGKDGCDFISCYASGDMRYNFHKNGVNYTPSGRAYVVKGHTRFYLDEFLRTDR